MFDGLWTLLVHGFDLGIVMGVAGLGILAGIATVFSIGYAAVLVLQFGVMVCVEWWGGIAPFLKLSPREIARRLR